MLGALLVLLGMPVGAQVTFPLNGNGSMGLGGPNGEFTVAQDDLVVKVPGGQARVNRDFDGTRWTFNRQWSGLGDPSYYKNNYGSLGAFFVCTTIDGVGNCDSTAQPGTGVIDVPNVDLYTRVPTDPTFGLDHELNPLPDQSAIQFVARKGIGFSRTTDGSTFVSSKYPRFIVRPQLVPVLPPSTSPDAHPPAGKPGQGGIAITEVNGYRWTDRTGQWIEYDNFGRISSYGDRNNVRVWMQNSVHGPLERVLDDNGRTVFTFLYSDNRRSIIEARDHTPGDGNTRRVQYQYDGTGRLHRVIDARGHETRFDYGEVSSVAIDFGGNPTPGYGTGTGGGGGSGTVSSLIVDTTYNMVKVTDAEGRETRVGYGVTKRVSRITAPDGGVYAFDYGYDKLKKEFSVTIKHPETEPGRKLETRIYDQEGRIVRREVNGKLLMSAQGGRQSMSYTDERNSTVRIDRNNFDEVTRRTNPDGSTISVTYEAASLDPREVVDEAGVATRLEYDNKGNLLRLTAAAGKPVEQVTEYQPNARGEPELVRRKGGANPDGSVDPDVELQLRYDAHGNVRELVDGEGKTWTYEHDAAGNMVTAIDPLGHAWTYTYDAHGNRLTATDPNQLTTGFSYDKTDRLLTITDPRQQVYRLDYDVAGRPQRMTDPTGSSVTLEYDAAGRLIASSDSMNQRVALAYDNHDRLVTVIDGEGNATGLDYSDVDGADRGGDLVSRINYPTLQRLLRYNNRQDLTQLSDVVDGDTRTTTMDYELRGLPRTRVNPYEKTQGVEYDALGRPTVGTDELGNTVQLGYDHRNNLISVTDELGHVTRLEYDKRDKLVREITAENEATVYRYDDAGRLQELIRPNGFRLTFEFDNGGRLQRRLSHRPDDSVELTDTFSWDDGNRLIGWATAGASSTMNYDDANRLLSQTVTIEGVGMTRQYTYHANGQVKTYTGPDGATLTYTYDGNSALSRVDIPGEGSMSVAERQWTEARKIVLPGGTVQEIERNGLLSPTRLRVRGPSQAVVFEQSSVYGKLDEVIRRTTQGQATNYTYDDALRLLEADPATSATETFELDAAGNRLSDNWVPATWEYDDANRLLKRGNVTYQYDPAGNLVVKTDASLAEPRRTTHYAYDGYNRLAEVRDGANAVVARYAYDPFGYRLSKEVTATGAANTGATAGKRFFLQAEEGLLAEIATDGVVLQGYGWQPERPYSTSPLFLRQSGDYFYYQNDPLGVPWRLTNKAGGVVWAANRIAAFGAVTVASGTSVEQPWRFPGQYYDEETGLHYNLHRYYNAETGRYTTSDPIGLLGGPNYYVYAASSPTSRIDPYGLDAMDWLWGGVNKATGGWDGNVDPVWDLVHKATGGWSPNQSTVNFWAGAGDAASFGLTNWIRDRNGTNDLVKKCSSAYFGGAAISALMTPLGRVGYMVQAARIPKLAQSGRQAVAMRNYLRYQYRGPLTRIPFFANWHMRTYLSFVARGRTESQIIANAGNTSGWWNSVLLFGSPAISAASTASRVDDCECE
ncbi:RHS repeat protein [Luteimonas sp. SJ-92]|uniref:RHS repeat protein n=1 Tax=Luteimonas salinisoli TaxID=2752307 RepID=A0A853J7S4_9GAMM|nr:RHS repeat protein [Luteimonas salinisoli]NZA25153.1 RHS repeat protein [Luteimonas salinisoli]